MKKFDNFCASLRVLASADFTHAQSDEVYRSGIVHQYSLTFELAWKALKQFMQDRDVVGAETGSTLDIIRLAYQTELISDYELWHHMSRDRNITNHVYNLDEVDAAIGKIQHQYLPALQKLKVVLGAKLTEAQQQMF